MLDTPLDIADCRTVMVNFNHCNYVQVKLHNDEKEYYLHRLIVGDVPDGYQVDHIDNNPLNNTRSNLRLVTARQNLLNRYTPNEIGYAGVSQVRERYQARVVVNGKHVYVGIYDMPEEAAMMRDEIMDVVGQGFSKCNFEKHERCLTDSHMRQVAAFLNKHNIKL
ncbi:TPA: hypothetical protein ACH3X3_003507 [Trebouxia sp. C0006]